MCFVYVLCWIAVYVDWEFDLSGVYVNLAFKVRADGKCKRKYRTVFVCDEWNKRKRIHEIQNYSSEKLNLNIVQSCPFNWLISKRHPHGERADKLQMAKIPNDEKTKLPNRLVPYFNQASLLAIKSLLLYF